jgi:hypothetical protein
LSRIKGELGTFLAMTCERINSEDAFASGLTRNKFILRDNEILENLWSLSNDFDD